MTKKQCGCRGLKQDKHPECDSCTLKRFGYLCGPRDTCSFCIDTTHKDWVIILAARRKREAKKAAEAEVAQAADADPPQPIGNFDSDDSDSQRLAYGHDWSSDSSFDSSTESHAPWTSQSDSSSSLHSVYSDMVNTRKGKVISKLEQSMLEQTAGLAAKRDHSTDEPRAKHAKRDQPAATESRPRATAHYTSPRENSQRPPVYEQTRDHPLYNVTVQPRHQHDPYQGGDQQRPQRGELEPPMSGQFRTQQALRRLVRDFNDVPGFSDYERIYAEQIPLVSQRQTEQLAPQRQHDAQLGKRVHKHRDDYNPVQKSQDEIDEEFQRENFSPQFRRDQADVLAQVYDDGRDNQSQQPLTVKRKGRKVSLDDNTDMPVVGQSPKHARRSRSPQRAPPAVQRRRSPSPMKQSARSPQRYQPQRAYTPPRLQQQRARSRSPQRAQYRDEPTGHISRRSPSPQHRVEQRMISHRQDSPLPYDKSQHRFAERADIRFAGELQEPRTRARSPVRSPRPHYQKVRQPSPPREHQMSHQVEEQQADNDDGNAEVEDQESDDSDEQISFQTLLKLIAHCAPEANLVEIDEQNFKASVVLQSGQKLDTRKFYGLSTASSITSAVKGFQKLFYDRDIKTVDKPLKYLELFHAKGGRPNMKPYKAGDSVMPAEGLKPPSSRFAWAKKPEARISLAVTDVTFLEEVAREGLRILSFLELLNQALKAAFAGELQMPIVRALHESSIQASKDLLLVNTIFAGSMVQLKRDNFLATVSGIDAKQKETLRHAPWDCSTELFSSDVMTAINLEHVAYLQTRNMSLPPKQRPPNKAKHVTAAQRGNKR